MSTRFFHRKLVKVQYYNIQVIPKWNSVELFLADTNINSFISFKESGKNILYKKTRYGA